MIRFFILIYLIQISAQEIPFIKYLIFLQYFEDASNL